MTTAISAKKIRPGPLNRTPPIATSRPVRPASRRKVRSWVLRRVPVTVFMVMAAPYPRTRSPLNLWDSHNLEPSGSPGKRTPARYRPCGGAVGPAALRCAPWSRTAGSRRPLAAARQQHRPDQRPHLVAQEARRGDREPQLVADLVPGGVVHGAHERPVLRLGRRERREVVRADAPPRPSASSTDAVERPAVVQCAPRVERARLAHHPHAVDVGAGAGPSSGR